MFKLFLRRAFRSLFVSVFAFYLGSCSVQFFKCVGDFLLFSAYVSLPITIPVLKLVEFANNSLELVDSSEPKCVHGFRLKSVGELRKIQSSK